MNLMGILLALSIATAFCGHCATWKVNNVRALKVDGTDRSVGPHVHFVDRTQLVELYESKPASYSLPNSEFSKGEGKYRTLAATFRHQLTRVGRCIPWIPGARQAFLCNPDGFGLCLLNKPGALHAQRNIFLIESLPNGLRAIRNDGKI
jgi:hypothetical protein